MQHKWIAENFPGDYNLVKICVNIGEQIFPDFKYNVILNSG